jgi:oligopeptidase B
MLAPRILISSALMLVAGCAHQGTDMKSEAPATAASTQPSAPVARIVPYTVASPQGDRVDPYYWLRDDTRSKPEVLDYLKAENDYTTAMLAHAQGAKDVLFKEIVGRIQQDDSSVPYLKQGWWLYTRFEQGKEYPIHARKRGSLEAPEEVLLDGNVLGAGKSFYQIGPGSRARMASNWFTPRTPVVAASSCCASRICRPANCGRRRSQTSRR